MLALTWMDDAEAGARIRETQSLTTRPLGVNLALQWPQRGRLAQCLEAGVPVISTFWGDPAPYVELVQDAGALHIHTVGSAEEARRVVGAGTFPLVPAVVEAVQPVPVLAAGGIATGRGLAAAFALGAAAGWVGIRHLLASEANVHPVYQTASVAATEADTMYGTVFDGGWPDDPHRTCATAP